jgi:hypothetical protein
MIDVLEHFSKEEGIEIITKLKIISSNILVSIPKVVSKQGAAFGNVLETHHATEIQVNTLVPNVVRN